MKKNVITFIIMVAMLTATFLTGCDNSEVNTDTATADQIVATADETSPTEDATATETEDKTEAPTEKSTEADNKKFDEDAEDNEEENQDSGSASNTSNNSSSGGSSTTTNKKPSSNSNSSSSSSSSSSNKKPSSGSNSSSNSGSSNSKPNTNNNNNSSNTNTKPAPAPVVTDDTDIPHSQLCTDANMQKVTSAVNNYFINLGMIYNPSLNANNCGWFYDCTSRRISECSVNYFKSNVISGFESEANAFLNMYDSTYSDLTFYCYAERRSDGEYDIYFCHE